MQLLLLPVVGALIQECLLGPTDVEGLIATRIKVGKVDVDKTIATTSFRSLASLIS